MPTKSLGSLPRDANSTPVQVGSSFETDDVTGTPQTSPLAVSSTKITLAIPTNAVEIVIRTNADLRVSDVTGMATYYVQSANTTETYQIGRMSNIYLIRDSSDATVQFRFNIV